MISAPSYVSLGDGNATSSSIGYMSSILERNINWFSTYDTYVKRATLVIFVGWLNNTAKAVPHGGRVCGGGTKLVCMTIGLDLI